MDPSKVMQSCGQKSVPSDLAAILADAPATFPELALSDMDSIFEGESNKKTAPITTLFVDIGGVLLTDGWDHHARECAAVVFNLDWIEMESRHRLNIATYEEGKITIAEYLNRVIFYIVRSFTMDEFREFIFVQSQQYPKMIELVCHLKVKYGLKVVVVSNEARELNIYRIQKFKLNDFIDAFISSCFVHLRKPDVEIYQLAIDIAQTSVDQIIYIENTPMFVEIAQSLGIRSILHHNFESTCLQLAAYGLSSQKAVLS